MKSLLTIFISFLATSAQAFNDYYDCLQVGSSSTGWNEVYKKYEGSASVGLDNPITIKLTDLNTDTPYLSGQSTTKLTKISSNRNTLWFIELTSSGTVVTWTLFDKNIEWGSPKVLLISSKSYGSGGAVNFTSIYECKS